MSRGSARNLVLGSGLKPRGVALKEAKRGSNVPPSRIGKLINDLEFCSLLNRDARAQLAAVGKSAVAPLIKALSSNRWYVRYDAALILGKIGDKRAVPHLIRLLYDDDRNIRAAGANALGMIGGSQVCTRLYAVLRSRKFRPASDAAAFALAMTGRQKMVKAALGYIIGSRKHRRYYKSAFIAIGPPAVPVLCEALSRGDGRLREETAEILGAITDRRAVEPLVKRLKDPRRAVRVASAYALRSLQDKSAVVPLCAALADFAVDVRHAACVALGTLKAEAAIPHLVKSMSAPSMTAAAASALKEIGRPALAPLLSCLNRVKKAVRLVVIETLGDLKEKDACRPLVRVLKEADADIQAAAAAALGALQDKRAVPALVDLLNGEPKVAMAAVDALGSIGGRKSCDALLGRLKTADESKVFALLRAVSKAKDTRAIPYIKQLMKKSPDGKYPNAYVDALADLGSEDARRIYARLADQDDKWARLDAIHRLMRLDDKRAIEPLRKLLNDNDRSIKRDAADLVFMMPQAEVAGDIGRLISAGEIGPGYGMSILGRIGEPAVNAMAEIYQSADGYRRARILAMGQRLRDVRFLTLAIEGLYDKDHQVRYQAKVTIDHQMGIKPDQCLVWEAKYYSVD